jgi:hypothetical protein
LPLRRAALIVTPEEQSLSDLVNVAVGFNPRREFLRDAFVA